MLVALTACVWEGQVRPDKLKANYITVAWQVMEVMAENMQKPQLVALMTGS